MPRSSPKSPKILALLMATLFLLSIIPEALPVSSSPAPSDSVRADSSSTVFYLRNASVGYAYRWYNTRSPHYVDFSSSGGDCANFVSQCLIAGGLSLHNGTNGTGYGVYPDIDRSTTYSNGTIPNCDYLHQHLVNYQPVDYAYVTTANASIPSWMEVGDVVIFGNSTDQWQHAMLVVWRNSTDMGLSAHTTDVWNASFWSELNYFGLANFYHIRDSGYNGNEFLFRVRASTLNVRVGPGKKDTGDFYQDIGDIHSGEIYIAIGTALDSSGNLWYHFWFDDRAAWCAANYSGNVYASPVNRERYLQIDVPDYLNVRTGPGTEYTDIGEVYPGMRFYPIYVSDSGWVKYFWGGQEVWSSGAYMHLYNYIDVDPEKNISRVFMGFYPYWLGTDDSFMQWQFISHLAWFGISLNANGTVADYNNWPSDWTGLVSDAHENRTKVLVTFTLFGSTDIHNLLSSESNRSTAINNILSAIVNGDADGAAIDFETPSSGEGTNLSLFIRELKENLTSQDPSYELAICLSAYPWSSQVWEDSGLFQDLNPYINYYFLMGYDYHWSESSSTGACGALFWSSDIDAYHAILKYLGYGVESSKFIYGAPYYGYDWPVNASEYNLPGAATKDTGSSRTYDSAMAKLSSTGAQLEWNESSKSPWFWYYDSTNSEYRQVWFDNATSIKYKYELVNLLDLAGAGTWALGYDASTSQLWNAIGEKIGNFSLKINYPSLGSLIGGTVNATVIAYGGVTGLYYRVPGGEWENASADINLHREWTYIGGIAHRGHFSVFHLLWDTNSLVPGNYTLEIKMNNSFRVEYDNFTYTVKRNIALEGRAWGSSDASALIDDRDYLDSNSGFASNDLNKSLYITLPSNYSIEAFKVHLWDGDGRYYQYRIEVSTDNSTWVEVVNRTSGEWRSWQWIDFPEGNLTARYVRITGTYNSANQWYHIIEFKIFSYNPEITRTSPADGATDVSASADIVVVYGETMDSAVIPTLNDSLNTTYNFAGWSTTTVTNDTATWTHADWPLNTTVNSTVSGGQDPAGNVQISYSWNFVVTSAFNIPVHAGWDLISYPLLASGDIESVLNDSNVVWDDAQWYNPLDAGDHWKSHVIGRTLNDLNTIDNTMAVWLHVTDAGDGNLTVSASAPTSTAIQLHAGWNLVSYPASSSVAMNSAGLPSEVTKIAQYDSRATYLVSEVSDWSANNFVPGDGYWLYSTADTTWTVTY